MRQLKTLRRQSKHTKKGRQKRLVVAGRAREPDMDLTQIESVDTQLTDSDED